MTDDNDDTKKRPLRVCGNDTTGLAERLAEGGDPGDEAVMDASRLRELAPDAYEILRCFYLPTGHPGVGGVAAALRIHRGPVAELDAQKLAVTMAASVLQAAAESLVAKARQENPDSDPVAVVDDFMEKVIEETQEAFHLRGFCGCDRDDHGDAPGKGLMN